MAGYFSKLVGYVYDGDNLASADLQNGLFVTIGATGVAVTSGAKDTVFRVHEITSKWGLPFVALDVVSIGDDEVFMVENEFEINDNEDYDERAYVIKSGKPVRMKRPIPGEQVYISVASALAAALSVGDLVTPTADGKIAAQ